MITMRRFSICKATIALTLILALAAAKTTTAQFAYADSMLKFMDTNKQKFALTIVANDTNIVAHNQNSVMPLASTVKTIVAIEFAKQASKKIIDTSKLISLNQLKKYYLANTDGGAHEGWINQSKQKKLIQNDSIALMHVARGMIQFSSNANTDYLIDLLGLENVNKNIKLFGLKQHQQIYPLVSSLLLYQLKGRKEKDLIAQLEKTSAKAYAEMVIKESKKLQADSNLLNNYKLDDLTMPMQAAWSNKLVAATTQDYAHLSKQLNRRLIFDSNFYKVFSRVYESGMETQSYKKRYLHMGQKGGSTAFVLTLNSYATALNGDKVEMAIFINNLSEKENEKLQNFLFPFQTTVLTNPAFRKKLQSQFQTK
jgi:D-alanyl-D-alanine carboxypeptidase